MKYPRVCKECGRSTYPEGNDFTGWMEGGHKRDCISVWRMISPEELDGYKKEA